MKRILLILSIILVPVAATGRGPRIAAGYPRHQIYAGWGDMLFEKMAFHGSPEFAVGLRTHDYSYTGHFFAGWRYSLTETTSLGAGIDMEGIFWKETPYGNDYKPSGPTVRVRNYNISILPEIRFTYLRTEWVRLHSGFSAGVNLALDNHGGAELAPALNLNLLGVEVGKGCWAGCIDFGLLSAMKSSDSVYMLGSRLVSASINYRF